MSLVEALIQAIHRLKRSSAQESSSGSGAGTKTGASFVDEEGASDFGPSLEFLSMLSGNRHREQVRESGRVESTAHLPSTLPLTLGTN